MGLVRQILPGRYRRGWINIQQCRGKFLARTLLTYPNMSFYNAELHCMMMSTGPHGVSAVAPPASAPASNGDGESFFHHILDVINPLQHLPVVGTIYRAITGEHIGPIEKIAGDGLYGGIWGAASATADVAFEAITGKSVEDTVLAWLKGNDNVAVANAKVGAPKIAFNASLPSADMPSLPGAATAIAQAQPAGNSIAALMASMNAQGLSGDMASRAMAAYRRSVQPVPVVASLN
jgi:hypothetical protein